MHELIRAAAIFSLCIGALLISSSTREEDTRLSASTVHLLSSLKGIVAIILMGAAIEGLTGFQTTLGLLLSALLGAFAALTLNAMNFRAANRRASPNRSSPPGARTLKNSRPKSESATTAQARTPNKGSARPAPATGAGGAPTRPTRKDVGR